MGWQVAEAKPWRLAEVFSTLSDSSNWAQLITSDAPGLASLFPRVIVRNWPNKLGVVCLALRPRPFMLN